MYYKTTPFRLFNAFNIVFLCVLAVTCLLPLVHTLAISLSGKAPVSANLVGLWPIDFTLDAYKKTLDNPQFLTALRISFERTIIGTIFGLAITVLAAYPLSKDGGVFKSRGSYSWFFLVTLFFGGGLIPTYIVIQKLGLMNSFWVLILPSALNVWMIVLLLNYFRTVPKELEEAALIDGAGQFRILFTVIIPVSLPAMATMALFIMVGHWNAWFDGLIYMSKSDKYPLATFLQTILASIDTMRLTIDKNSMANFSNKTVKTAQVFIGALPVLLVYPFLQRYFIKGLVLGAVKE